MTNRVANFGSALRARPHLILWWLPSIYALVIGFRRLPPDSEPLWPDASGYFARAAEFDPSLWLGDVREPVWPTLNAIPLEIFGNDPTVLRASGVIVLAGLILATQYLTRHVLGFWFGLAAGAALVIGDWLIYQAVQGMREELAALLTVVVAYVLMRLKPGWRSSLGLGLLIGIAAMTRWDTLILTLPITAVAFYVHRVRIVHALACLAVATAIILPFCIGNAIKYDDPLYHSNIRAVWFRNLEFAGQDGLPSREELSVDAYSGPKETWSEYLVGRHDLPWLVKYTVRGTVNTALSGWALMTGAQDLGVRFATGSFSEIVQSLIPWLLLTATAAGCWRLLRRGAWIVPLSVALALLQHAPIQHLMDQRLGLGAIPFMVVAAMAAFQALLTRLRDVAVGFVRGAAGPSRTAPEASGGVGTRAGDAGYYPRCIGSVTALVAGNRAWAVGTSGRSDRFTGNVGAEVGTWIRHARGPD
jgi:hypothetical protein